MKDERRKDEGPKTFNYRYKVGYEETSKSPLFDAMTESRGVIGTSSIVDEKTHEPLLSILSLIVETAVKLHKDGHKVIIVSSGAIGVGLRRMDLDKRPKHLPRVQVCLDPSRFIRECWINVFDVGIGSNRTMSSHKFMG